MIAVYVVFIIIVIIVVVFLFAFVNYKCWHKVHVELNM